MRRIAVIAAAALTVVALAPGPAGATNFSGANSRTGCTNGSPVNMADNGAHSFYYSFLGAAAANAQTWTRVNIYDPSDVNTSQVSQSSSTVDVIVMDADYVTYCGYTWDGASFNYWGLTTCTRLAGARCEQHEIRYDQPDLERQSLDGERGLACHETGHSLGLTHRDTELGCMYTSGPYMSFLNSHGVRHLNDNY